jgi:hypothetical protein
MRPSRSTFLRVRRAAALLLPLVAACGGRDAPPPPTPVEAQLVWAWREVRALSSRPAHALTDEEVITLGYVERLRLGLGSPFRLMDYALQDPRLSPAARTRAAAALLQATREGRAYALDPRALTRIGVDSAGRAEATARVHRALIEQAVTEADDPRAGELAVRAAYQLAAAEHALTSQAPALAAQAAALARDRVIARRDAGRLLDEAERTARHPLALLREWRAARRFEVEAPTAAARPPHLEVRAAAAALPLAHRAVLAAKGGGAEMGEEADRSATLSPGVARRLSALSRRQNPPPSPPVQLTVERYRDDVGRELDGTRRGRVAAVRFLAQARTEERFAAELARLDSVPPAAAQVAMEAAVALRAYAQEAVWYPGFPAPSEADLKRAYGLAAVGYDDDVPPHWRAFYRRMLGESLADLESAQPGLDVQGLSFRIGRTRLDGTAIAVHYPRTRTIHLPPGTGPGSIAHEVAHDLDWQVGRDRYSRRGSYGTDLALHRGGADRFAAAVRRLPLAPAPSVRRTPGESTRPAEAFARLFDGYVTATLAARGRSNGYLSSLQDDVLTGTGTAMAPDPRGDAAEAFLPLLMIASPLTEAQAGEFRLRWGALRSPGPLSLMAEVAAAAREEPASRRAPRRSLVDRENLDGEVRARIAEVDRVRERALRTRATLVCANPFLSPLMDGEAAVRALIDAAADARIRGILRRWGQARGMRIDPDLIRRAWVEAPAAASGASAPAPPAPDWRPATLTGCGR